MYNSPTDIKSLCFGIHADSSITHHIGLGGPARTHLRNMFIEFEKFVLMRGVLFASFVIGMASACEFANVIECTQVFHINYVSGCFRRSEMSERGCLTTHVHFVCFCNALQESRSEMLLPVSVIHSRRSQNEIIGNDHDRCETALRSIRPGPFLNYHLSSAQRANNETSQSFV